MLEHPKCLHIPVLNEDSEAVLSWESVDGASSYTLEGVFDETFESAGTGRTWSNINSAAKSWEEIERESLSWLDFAALPAQGLSWENLALKNLSWKEIEDKDITWRQFHELPASFVLFEGAGTEVSAPSEGMDWQTINNKAFTWNDVGNASWEQIGRMHSTGLDWNCIQAKSLSWQDLADMDLSWEAIRKKSDSLPHIAHTIKIPFGKESAYFRVKANSGIEESGWFSTIKLPIIPLFRHEDEITLAAVQGGQKCVKLVCERALEFERYTFSVTYDPKRLELIDFEARSPEEDALIPDAAAGYLKIESNKDGRVQFKLTRKLPRDSEWTGLATAILFKALSSGETKINLM